MIEISRKIVMRPTKVANTLKEFWKNNWLSVFVILGTLLWALQQMSELPTEMPSHFSPSGSPDRFQNKYFVLFFLPCISLFTLSLIFAYSILSPANLEKPKNRTILAKLNLAVSVFLSVLYIGIVLQSKFPETKAFQRLLTPAFSMLMVFIGNYLERLERNYIIGVRLPWTLTSEENWRHTHIFSGRVFMVGGAISLLALFLGGPAWLPIVVFMAVCLACIFYSYRYFLKYEERHKR